MFHRPPPVRTGTAPVSSSAASVPGLFPSAVADAKTVTLKTGAAVKLLPRREVGIGSSSEAPAKALLKSGYGATLGHQQAQVRTTLFLHCILKGGPAL